MLFLAFQDFTRFVNSATIAISNNITQSLPRETIDKTKSELFNKMSKGAIVYDGFRFKGYFNSITRSELVALGAIKDKWGYYLQKQNMPNWLLDFINNQQRQVDEFKRKVAEYLAATALVFVLPNTGLVSRFAREFDLKMKKNCKQEGVVYTTQTTKIEDRVSDIITDGIRETLRHTSKHVAELKVQSKIQVVQYLQNEISKSVKNRITHDINKTLFDIQADICKKNGAMHFYWWHVPQKKPTDRPYHRKHFEASKKGKKFYFNNLPTWNGMPDFPGKLWNCRCRAVVDFKKFLSMC